MSREQGYVEWHEREGMRRASITEILEGVATSCNDRRYYNNNQYLVLS